MTEFLVSITQTGLLIVAALTILVFALVLAVGYLTARPQVDRRRLRAVLASGRAAAGTPPASVSRALLAGLRRLLTAFNLIRTRQVDDIVITMAQAGWRSRDAIVVYVVAKLVLPVVVGAGLSVALFVIIETETAWTIRLMGVLAAVLVASFLPEWVVRRAAAARRRDIERALPDGFDLLVIGVEAGSSLDAAIERVGAEMRTAAPALADEMRTTALELQYMPERRQAMDNLARRVDLPAVQALATTLAQTERFGTPLAQALRVLASELRTARMMKAEERAARLPVLMTLPLIAFILPALFIVLMGPAVLSLIRNFSAL